jgi:hypothetical protein
MSHWPGLARIWFLSVPVSRFEGTPYRTPDGRLKVFGSYSQGYAYLEQHPEIHPHAVVVELFLERGRVEAFKAS